MYFILVTSKNFKVGIIKLPVKLLLLQPYKFSNSLCSGSNNNKKNTYCTFIKDSKNASLNSKMPDDAAFSRSMPRGVLFVVTLNTVSWYRGSGMVLFRRVVNYC